MSGFDGMDPELSEIAGNMTPEEMRQLANELERRAKVMRWFSICALFLRGDARMDLWSAFGRAVTSRNPFPELRDEFGAAGAVNFSYEQQPLLGHLRRSLFLRGDSDPEANWRSR
jgi:hypothetical protein